MRFMEDDPRRHDLRTGFDRAAEDCQRTRQARSVFAEVTSRRYPFQVPYWGEDYLTNPATQSGPHVLGEARRTEFLARVRHRLESLGWPRLTATFVGYLIVGRRR